jgi:hypothetical protein
MSWSIDEAAQVMGMPPHEVLAVAEVGDCHVVTTHDGQHTLVTAEGKTSPLNEESAPVPPGAAPEEAATGDESAEGTATEGGEGTGTDGTEGTATEATESTGDGTGEDNDPPGPDSDGDGVPDDVDGDGVPDGNAKQIQAWVGEDKDRAAAALAAEDKRAEGPRSTLVAALEKVAQA